MDQQNPQQSGATGSTGEEPLDAAASRLQQEMETALRHLRERAWGPWHPPERRGQDADSPESDDPRHTPR